MTSRRILIALLAVVVVIGAFVAAYRITLWGTRSQSLTTPGASVPAEENAAETQAGQLSVDAEQTADPSASGETAQAAADPMSPAPASSSAGDPEQTAEQAAPDDNVTPTYVNGILIVNKSYPLPRSYGPGGLTGECESAFEEMRAAAAEEGLDLYVSSGFRSYELQASLYQRYCDSDGQEAADTYSARPGHSEHQTGLAIDLNTITSDFAYTAEGQWVNEHCWEYGFILRYPADKVAVTGYMYEPWHIRYLGKDVAKDVYESGLCLEEYLGVDSVYR